MFKPEIDPHAWPDEARTVLTNKLHRVQNPEPQQVPVERVQITASLDIDAPAKARRPGIAVPMMPRIDAVPEGHVDAMANVHSWDR